MKNYNQTTAVLIDGGFFLKRYAILVDPHRQHTPEQVANNICKFALRHTTNKHLHRIFYYDCFPFDKKVCNPVSNKIIDFSKSLQYKFRVELFEELKKKRKVALRLGTLKDSKNWSLRPATTKALLQGKLKLENVKESDVTYDLRQKGIDMKIGVDIASLALTKFVNQIVLVSTTPRPSSPYTLSAH